MAIEKTSLTIRALTALDALRGDASPYTTLDLKASAMQFPVNNYGTGGSSGLTAGYGYGGVYRSSNGTPNFGVNGWGFATQGSAINYQEAAGSPLQSSLVMSAVRWLGHTLPEAPLLVREAILKGDAQTIAPHPLIGLMRRPNPYYSGATLWKAIALSWIIDGNVFLIKIRNRVGGVIQLWYVPHWMMWPVWDSTTDYISHYVYRVDGVDYIYAPEDVIHFRDGIDPYYERRGLSPLGSLFREIYADNEAAAYSALVMKNAGVPPFVIIPKAETAINEEEAAFLKTSIMRRVTGDKRGEPFVLSSGVDIKELAFSPDKMAVRLQRQLPEERLSSVIGIPAIVLNFGAGLEHGSFANYLEAREQAYEQFLSPLWQFFGEELTVQLLPDFDTAPNRFVTHDLSVVRALQEDADAKAKRIESLYLSGLLLRSDARSALGYGPTDESIKDVDKVLFDPRGGTVFSPGEDPSNSQSTAPSPKSFTFTQGKGSPDQPRDDHGRYDTTGGVVTVTESQPSSRAAIAKANYKATEKDKQDHAENNEVLLASKIGGKSLSDNEPMDVVIGHSGDKTEHGIEVKTILDSGKVNAQISMKPEAIARKAEWSKAQSATVHTVVIDDRNTFRDGAHKENYSGNRLYYRRATGNLTINSMYAVKNYAELKTLIATPTNQLPPKAR